MVFSFLKPYIIPIVLSIATTVMTIKEILAYNKANKYGKQKLIRRLFGLSAMFGLSLSIAIGIYYLEQNVYSRYSWLITGILLLLTLLIGAWDAKTELKSLERELSTMCREDLEELEKLINKK